MRRSILSGAVCLILAGAPAAAGGMQVNGDIAAGYTRLEQGDAKANVFGGSARALITIGSPGLNVQFSGSGADYSGGGIDNAWSAAGDIFWRDRKGSIGASVAHSSVGIGLYKETITSYGGFGEWYATRRLTLRWKGGAYSGDASGKFAGAGAEYYMLQDLGLFADYTYWRTSGVSRHIFSGGAEWQFSDEVPLSLRVSGDYQTGGGSHIKGVTVALRYRMNLSGVLVTLDRIGTTTWNGAFPYF